MGETSKAVKVKQVATNDELYKHLSRFKVVGPAGFEPATKRL
jgi:hypothetical protein